MPTKARSFSAIDPLLAKCLIDFAAGVYPWPLLLYGDVGCGKTCAALALSDLAASVRYTTLSEMCDCVIRKPDGMWSDLQEFELLILDELGLRNTVTDLEHTTLVKILDEREGHNDSVGIYITNHSPDVLRKLYDDRIVSRLLSGTTYHAVGVDRRVA